MSIPLDPQAPSDFDFIIGDWRVQHRRLDARLVNCQTWTSFEGRSSTAKILGGFGNLEDNLLQHPDGPFHAVAMRAYDPATRQWSIWWLDGRNPTQLDVPVVGSFDQGVGVFLANDVLDGKAIQVRFTWDSVSEREPLWAQAFSADGGQTWETNWTMRFLPA